MVKVFRAINHNVKQVHHGVIETGIDKPSERKEYVRTTPALQHWDFSNHKIIWRIVSKHRTMEKALKEALRNEKIYKHAQKFEILKSPAK